MTITPIRKGYVESRPGASGRSQAGKERQAAEHRRRQQEEETRERDERKTIAAYWESLTPEQQAELQATADARLIPSNWWTKPARSNRSAR